MGLPYCTPHVSEPQTASVGEYRPVRMDADAIIRLVSKDLYAHPASGVRELFANEIVAAMRAGEAGADPHIEATITPDMVRIWGRDSLGIERQVFDEIYMCLGRSGNFDSARPGQFGLGRAAYTTIADRILIETHHRNGDRYTALGIEGRGYQVDVGGTDIEYGTRVTMVPAAGVWMDVASMKETVRRMASRTRIPVTLTTRGGSEPIPYEPIAREPAGGDCIYADLPDVEFAAWTTITLGYGTDVDAYLCGVPIEFNYRGRHHWGIRSLRLDIRDEIKHPPTPDRERLTAEAEAAITETIDAELDRMIGAFPADTAEALKRPDRRAMHPLLPGGHGLCRVVWVYGIGPMQLGAVLGIVLNCREFGRHMLDAVSAACPGVSFVRNVPEAEPVESFMERNDIAV